MRKYLLCAATWSPRRLARAAPNWMFRIRSLPQPNGPANALDLPTSAHTRRDGPGCRSIRRSVVAAIRSAQPPIQCLRSARAASQGLGRPALNTRSLCRTAAEMLSQPADGEIDQGPGREQVTLGVPDLAADPGPGHQR